MKSSKSTGVSKSAAKKKILTRGVSRVVESKHLVAALSSGKKLRVKLGIDATAPDLHLGNAVVLRKLREFQDLGHRVVFIIGDFTTKIGDPSGQSKERKVLTDKEIKANMKNYLSQAGKIIDMKKAEVRHNSEWLGKSVEELLELSSTATINQVSEREDFRERIKKGQKVTLQEALYALLQGYDSVKIKADVELGGDDQLLNLLMGRQIQRHFGMEEQDIVTVPLLEGTDGVRKMSKSYGNYIALEDAPDDMYGKVMSVPDKLIQKYFELCTDVSEKEAKAIMKKGPRDAKARLAYEIVKLYHGEKHAKAAGEEFNKVFQRKERPTKIKTIAFKKHDTDIVGVLVAAEFVPSKSGAHRLIKQGGVRVNGKKVTEPKTLVKDGDVVQSGKRRFVRVSI